MNKKELAEKAKRDLAKKNQNNTQKEEVKMEVKDQVVEENTLVDAGASEAANETVVNEVKAEEGQQETNAETPDQKEEEQAPADQAPENTENNEGQEEKKEEEPKKEDKKQLSESDKSAQIINSLIARNAGLKIVATDSKTGISYFSGKKRLCKLLKTKRGVTLEINVALPQAFKDMPDMENISAVTAMKKHLGTMKHLYRGNDAKQVPAIMKEAIAIFKAELEAAKAQEQKEEKQAANQ